MFYKVTYDFEKNSELQKTVYCFSDNGGIYCISLCDKNIHA